MLEDCVIVLNMYSEFCKETTVRKAVRKVLNGRATNLIADEETLLGVVKLGWGPDAKWKPIYKPLVIRLDHFDYYHYKSEHVPYSDRQVYDRDKNVCQYWHEYTLNENGVLVPTERHQHLCTSDEKTIDHVIPVSRGGARNSYTNAVCCCRYCNEIIKKDQTPEEAGLTLIKKPKPPVRIKGDIARNFFNFNPKILAHKRYKEYLHLEKFISPTSLIGKAQVCRT